MKVLNDINIIIIGKTIYYNYNNTLYTKEQFEDKYFLPVNTASKPQEEIKDLFDIGGNICVKLQRSDYVKFSFDNEYNQHISGEGIITRVEYDDNDRMEDCYVVKTSNDPHETIIIYGHDIDKAWR